MATRAALLADAAWRRAQRRRAGSGWGMGCERYSVGNDRHALPAIVMVSSDTITKGRITDSDTILPVLLLDSKRVYAALGRMSIGPDRSMTIEIKKPGLA
jgi:hypothetical protein